MVGLHFIRIVLSSLGVEAGPLSLDKNGLYWDFAAMISGNGEGFHLSHYFPHAKRPVVDLFKQYVAVFRQYVRRKSLFGNVANHLRKKEL